MPYYFFFMVLLSLFFSAHMFYTSLRNILFPQLRESDDNYRPVKLNQVIRVSTRKRFRVLLVLISALLLTFTILVLVQH